MIRRTLQFVLMLAILVSASVAQAASMPCCQITPQRVVAAPAADKYSGMSMEHCHGDMHHAVAFVHSMTPCASPACAQPLNVANTPADETVLLPPSALTSDGAALSHRVLGALSVSSTPNSDPPRYAPVPLRV
jgi:hypothetical protein